MKSPVISPKPTPHTAPRYSRPPTANGSLMEVQLFGFSQNTRLPLCRAGLRTAARTRPHLRQTRRRRKIPSRRTPTTSSRKTSAPTRMTPNLQFQDTELKDVQFASYSIGDYVVNWLMKTPLLRVLFSSVGSNSQSFPSLKNPYGGRLHKRFTSVVHSVSGAIILDVVWTYCTPSVGVGCPSWS